MMIMHVYLGFILISMYFSVDFILGYLCYHFMIEKFMSWMLLEIVIHGFGLILMV